MRAKSRNLSILITLLLNVLPPWSSTIGFEDWSRITWAFVMIKPSEDMMNPEPFEIEPEPNIPCCLSSILTVDGRTSSTTSAMKLNIIRRFGGLVWSSWANSIFLGHKNNEEITQPTVKIRRKFVCCCFWLFSWRSSWSDLLLRSIALNLFKWKVERAFNWNNLQLVLSYFCVKKIQCYVDSRLVYTSLDGVCKAWTFFS